MTLYNLYEPQKYGLHGIVVCNTKKRSSCVMADFRRTTAVCDRGQKRRQTKSASMPGRNAKSHV